MNINEIYPMKNREGYEGHLCTFTSKTTGEKETHIYKKSYPTYSHGYNFYGTNMGKYYKVYLNKDTIITPLENFGKVVNMDGSINYLTKVTEHPTDYIGYFVTIKNVQNPVLVADQDENNKKIHVVYYDVVDRITNGTIIDMSDIMDCYEDTIGLADLLS